MTRWSTKDLTAQLIKAQGAEDKADKWEVVEFPAILPSGKPVWPEYWKLEDLLSVKASAGISKWNAQYMQNPTSEEGAIIKREWWQDWDEDYVPPIEQRNCGLFSDNYLGRVLSNTGLWSKFNTIRCY
jgi:hypothetical protein